MKKTKVFASLLLLLAILGIARLLLKADFWFFLRWWFVILVCGWSFWPLADRFTNTIVRGYLPAKAIGLLLPALALWCLTLLNLLPFNRGAAFLMCLATGLWAWGGSARRRKTLSFLTAKQNLATVFLAESLFSGAFLLGIYARGLKPGLDSLEKFMNVGFMNSLWRTTSLPAKDMWFAGKSINYYYFGQYFFTFLAKLTAIVPAKAYNLGMGTVFSLVVVLAFSFGTALIKLFSRSQPALKSNKQMAGLAGFLSLILVAFAGNGHAFFFQDKSPGLILTRWLNRRGLIASNPDKAYWFADATRFIGYNPVTTDKTIHEFPFYSFLVADLHAHLINLIWVLLLLIVLLKLIDRDLFSIQVERCRQKQEELASLNDLKWYRGSLAELGQRCQMLIKDPLIWAVAILLAVFMMGNYWDFVIYLALTALVLLAANFTQTVSLKPLSFLFAFIQLSGLAVVFLSFTNPLWALLGYALSVIICHFLTIIKDDYLTITIAQVSWILFSAHLISLPFNLSFEPIAKNIARTVNVTPFYQLAILWSPHVLAGLCLVLVIVFSAYKKNPRVFPPPAHYRSDPQGLSGFFSPVQTADKFAIIIFIWAVVLLALPELVYVVDIYSGDFKRANTMFKFTYQAFLLLSLIWAYAPLRLFADHRPRGRRPRKVLAAVLSLCLIIPLWYTLPAAGQWLGSFNPANYRGLDGLSLLSAKDSVDIADNLPASFAPDVAAIDWFNQTVSGQPVILEAYGDSYTDYCRISTFTGLPTVVGWETHEWLWRTSRDTPEAYSQWVLPRQNDVLAIYTTHSQTLRQELLDRYDIAYIVIGNLERSLFSSADGENLVNEEQLSSCGSVVFSEDSLYIVQVERD